MAWYWWLLIGIAGGGLVVGVAVWIYFIHVFTSGFRNFFG